MKTKICPLCKEEIMEKEPGIFKCSCGYTEITAINVSKLEDKDFKYINVPLNWVELDEIILALRLVNHTFKGHIHDKLEEKLNSYSMEAKDENNKYLNIIQEEVSHE